MEGEGKPVALVPGGLGVLLGGEFLGLSISR